MLQGFEFVNPCEYALWVLIWLGWFGPVLHNVSNSTKQMCVKLYMRTCSTLVSMPGTSMHARVHVITRLHAYVCILYDTLACLYVPICHHVSVQRKS